MSGLASRNRGSAPSTSPKFAGPFAVGVTQITVEEPTGAGNPVPAEGAPRARVITTFVRYPSRSGPAGTEVSGAVPDVADGPYPLVVFSQGFDMSAARYQPILDAWVQAGFVVAEPLYPRTDPSAPAGVDRADLAYHPGDLRFVISQLTSSPVELGIARGLIDTAEIVVAGQSDGGDVSLAVAAGSCCLDSRIRGAMILSGAEYAGFDTSYFAQPHVPLLLTQGTADTINPPVCSNQIYDAAGSPLYYVQLLGADHLSPYTTTDSYERVVVAVTLDFLEAITRGDSGALSRLASDGSVPGTASYLGPGSSLPLEGSCPDAPPGI